MSKLFEQIYQLSEDIMDDVDMDQGGDWDEDGYWMGEGPCPECFEDPCVCGDEYEDDDHYVGDDMNDDEFDEDGKPIGDFDDFDAEEYDSEMQMQQDTWKNAGLDDDSLDEMGNIVGPRSAKWSDDEADDFEGLEYIDDLEEEDEEDDWEDWN